MNQKSTFIEDKGLIIYVIILNSVPNSAYKQLKLKEKEEAEFASKTFIADSQGNIKLPSKLLNEISLKKGSFNTLIKVKKLSPLTLECQVGVGGK